VTPPRAEIKEVDGDQKGDWLNPIPDLGNERSHNSTQEHIWYQQVYRPPEPNKHEAL